MALPVVGVCDNPISTKRTMSEALQTLVLGAGCFWCSESVYLQVRGVQSVESGYSNGLLPNPAMKW